MMKTHTIFSLMVASALIAGGCSDDSTTEPDTGTLTLTINGLGDLEGDAQYEGWIIVGGEPVSTGTFTIDDMGMLSSSEFSVDADDLAAAEAFVLTIEPMPDPDPMPSDIHVLAGSFSGNQASITVGDPAALGNDFSMVEGTYVLATPTNGDMSNENSGVWFLELDMSEANVGLKNLPNLPDGWRYEGWTIFEDGDQDLLLSTGRFTTADEVDLADPYSGTMPGPPFPGEDFLINAPSGLLFPTDLSGEKLAITIEPEPDNSPLPFFLKPLTATVPADAQDHTNYGMMNESAQFPNGTVAR